MNPTTMEKGIRYLGLFSLAAGASAIVYKMSVDAGVTPLDLTLAVSLIALFILAPFLYSKKAGAAIRKKAKELAVVGLSSNGAAMLLLTTGLLSTTATHSGFIFALIPVLTVLSARVMLKERLSRHFPAILVLMTAGGILLAMRNGFSALNPGDAMVFAAAILLAYNNTYTKTVTQTIPPDTVTLGRLAFSTLFLLAMGWIVSGTNLLASIWAAPVFVAVAGVLSAASALFIIRGIDAEGASVSSLANLTASLVTALIGLTLLQEQLVGIQAIGAGLIAAGAVVFVWVQKQERQPVAKKLDAQRRKNRKRSTHSR